MKSAKLFSIALLFATGANAKPSPAVTRSDAQANRFVSLFQDYCVASGGTRDAALKDIDGKAFAKPLPGDVINRLQGGRKGGTGWLIQTNSGRAILAYDPIGVCEVAVVSADPDAIRRSFGNLISTARSVLKVTVTEGKPLKQSLYETEVVATPFSFPLFGKIVTLTLTTAGKTMPVGFQHTMTSAFNPIEKAN